MIITFATGSLTKDATTQVITRNGQKVEFISFTIACNETIGETRETTYFNVTASKSGIFPYLKKGQPVSVVGSFRQSESRNQEGKAFQHNNLSAFRVELAGKKGQEPQVQPGEW